MPRIFLAALLLAQTANSSQAAPEPQPSDAASGAAQPVPTPDPAAPAAAPASTPVVVPAPEPVAAPEPEPATQPAAGAIPVPTPEAEPEPGAIPAPKAPVAFTAPNPPACAAEFADATLHTTKFATGILSEMTACARRMGWYGQTIYGDKRVFPFHNQRFCASVTLGEISMFTSIIADLEAAMFDCFNNNQGCGQSIAKAIQYLLDVGQSLTDAGTSCADPGGDPPFNSNTDIPIQGLSCWANVWHVIQRLVKAAKFIDVALSLCPMDAPGGDGTPEPEPEDDGTAPEPTPTAEETPDPELGAEPDSWEDLEQSRPFAPRGEKIRVNGQASDGAVERRLSAEAALRSLLQEGDDEKGPPKDLKSIKREIESMTRTIAATVNIDMRDSTLMSYV